MNEDLARRLLWDADRTAPVPPAAPVSLAVLRARCRRRRAAALVAVLLAGTAGSQLLRLRPAPGDPAAARAALALRAEVDRLRDALAALQGPGPGEETGTLLALERSAMASLSYAERLDERGDPRAAAQFQRVARVWPGTAAGRLAGRRDEDPGNPEAPRRAR